MLIAVTMVVPCAAAMEATDVIAAEESTGFTVGDAWGISYSGDKDDLVEYLLGQNEEELSPENQEIYDLLYAAIKSANLDMAFITEVTRADGSGYTMTVDGGIRFKLSAEYVGSIDSLDIPDIIFNMDGYLDVIILLRGVVNLNTDSMVTSANLDLDVIVDTEVTTNLSLMKLVEYIEYIEYIDGLDDFEYDEYVADEENVMHVEELFTDTNNTSKLKIGASLSYILYSTGESVVDFVYDDEDNTIAPMITLNGKNSINASIFANISGELAEVIISNVDEDSDFDRYIIDENTIQASQTFSHIFMGETELPGFTIPVDEDVDYNADNYLNSTDKAKIRNDFNSIKDAYNGAVSGLKFTVTYNIDGEETTQLVAFNGFINPPAVLDNSAGDKFIGWITEDETDWNPSWKVKGDLTLYPVYAKSFTVVSELIDHMQLDPFTPSYGYIRINGLDGLTDAFESDDFQFNGTMFIDVYDENNNFLYSWKISNDNTALDPGTTMDLKIDGGNLTDAERSILSDGRHSGEGNFTYINFAASGLMPGMTTVTYNVGDTFENGTVLQIYYVITDGDGNIIGLELVNNVTVVNGNAIFNLDHCSGYVLSEVITSDGGSNNTLLYIGIIVVAIVVIALAAMLVMRNRSKTA